MTPRLRALLLLLVGVVLLAALQTLTERRGAVRAWLDRAEPTVPTVVLVVLDTVRSDHLSLCGYGRPTSPVLERLAAEGAAWTCAGVAPGSWTLPSHATYFTGAPPWVHRADFDPGADRFLGSGLRLRPLGPELPTLAEEMAAEGRATVLVSANPVLQAASGLARGFQAVEVAARLGEVPASVAVDLVRRRLREAAREGTTGLFLMVNLVDAHEPCAAIPPGLGWVPPRPVFWFDPHSWEEHPLRRMMQGKLRPDEVREELQAKIDGYDYGIHLADRGVGQILEVLENTGWTRAGLRFVVTSDHGEMLGEHGMYSHGGVLAEGNARVPVLALGVDGRFDANAPISAGVVYDILRTGAVPASFESPIAVTRPAPTVAVWSDGRFGARTEVGLWDGHRKLVASEEELRRYDLAADPTESAPTRAPREETPDRVRHVEQALAEALQPAAIAPELLEALRAAGYME